eukprot:3124446-Heterocapsa_arctica.AAC.1
MPHAPRDAAELLTPGTAYDWEWLKHAPAETRAAYPSRRGTQFRFDAAVHPRSANHVNATTGALAHCRATTIEIGETEAGGQAVPLPR